jgi:chromosome partitioning protein
MSTTTQAQVVAVANQKGGVGKTTTTINLGVELGLLGQKVLIIDIDPQANTTRGIGIKSGSFQDSIYDVLLNYQKGAGFAIIPTGYENVAIIPSVLALAGAELEIAGKVGREILLRRALVSVAKNYDWILIDAPPSLGIFTMNALVAAKSVIVPVQAETFALEAVPMLESSVALAQELNQELKVGGLLITMFDKRTRLSVSIEQQARAQYGKLVFNTVIPEATKMAEAPAFGEAIKKYAPNSPAAVAYASLAKEILESYVN